MKIVWHIFCGVTFLFAGLIQLDRSSYQDTSLSLYLPLAFKDFSLAQESLQDLERGRADQALSKAERFLFKHPIPAESLTVLAIVQAKNENFTMASRAITLSAQRGWREPTAQRAIITSASKEQQWGVVANRLVALWKTNSGKSIAEEMTPLSINRLEVMQIFAKRLGDHPPWNEKFLGWAIKQPPNPSVVKILELASKNGVRFRCRRIWSLTQRYLEYGHDDLADRAWRAQCGKIKTIRKASLVFDNNAVNGTDPYQWKFPSAAGVNISFQKNAASKYNYLAFDNTEPLDIQIANRYTSFRAPNADIVGNFKSDNGDGSIGLVLLCLNELNGTSLVQEKSISPGQFKVQLKIPKSNCRVQKVSLIAKRLSSGMLAFKSPN